MRSVVMSVVAIATFVCPFALTDLSKATEAGDDARVEVVKISGHVDPILVDFIERSIQASVRSDAVALVLQIDSPGGVVANRTMARLIQRVVNADVTVGAWVGPSGATAGGAAARLVAAADRSGVSPGSTLTVDGRTLGARTARDVGRVDEVSPTLGDFIVNVPDVDSRRVRRDGQIRREPITRTRFSQLRPVEQLMHTVASPPVAYLLFVIGMALLVFELYTAGIGLAGVAGAVCFVLACFGLAVLPTTRIGVGALLLAMFGYSVDIQTGLPRVWTAVATVALVVGSLLLYEGVALSWITLVVVVVGVTVVMLAGMPAMVRARFSTPTIGRDWIVGEGGVAQTTISPDGIVLVRNAPWRAHTHRATPVSAGDEIRVESIDGLVLQVEPRKEASAVERAQPDAGPSVRDNER